MKYSVLFSLLVSTMIVSCKTTDQTAETGDKPRASLQERILNKFSFHTHREHLEADQAEQRAARLEMKKADEKRQLKQTQQEDVAVTK